MTDQDKLIEAMVDAVEQLFQPQRGRPDPVIRTLPPWSVVMKAALAAHTAHLEANGMVIVPREATMAMIDGAHDIGYLNGGIPSKDAYKAMIDACTKQSNGVD